MKWLHLFLALVTVLGGTSVAASQDYPSRLIRIVVAYAAGGGTDSAARPTAQKLSQLLGQPVIVENRPGANSIIGTDFVAKSNADGYTLLINPASQLLIPFYSGNVPYNAVADFTPIMNLSVNRRVIVVNPQLPINNLKELIDYARKNPGKLSFGVAAAGSAQELAGDVLKAEAGIDIVSIPYRGGAPALQGLLAGDIGMAILVVGDVIELVRAGKLRGIAIVDGARSKIAPEIPTVAESGITLVPEQWLGVMGPRGLSAPVANLLNESLGKVLAEPQVHLALETLGYEVAGGTREAFATRMQDDIEKYRALTQKLGIRPKAQ